MEADRVTDSVPGVSDSGGAARPPAAEWLEAVALPLRLSRRSVIVLIDGACPARLRELVRRLLPDAPELQVLAGVQGLAEVAPGSTVILAPAASDAGWLNLGRAIIAERELKLVLWCDAATAAALRRDAPDFFDWISHRVECPGAPAAHAVCAVREAVRRRATGIVILGVNRAEVERIVRAARPRRAPRWVDPQLGYRDLLAALRAATREALLCFDITRLPRRIVSRTLYRVVWALAETGRRYPVVLLGREELPIEGWQDLLQVRGDHMDLAAALATLEEILGGQRGRAGRLAALLGLDQEAVQLARRMLERQPTLLPALELDLSAGAAPRLVLGAPVVGSLSMVGSLSIGTSLGAAAGSALARALVRVAGGGRSTVARRIAELLRRGRPPGEAEHRELVAAALEIGDLRVAQIWLDDGLCRFGAAPALLDLEQQIRRRHARRSGGRALTLLDQGQQHTRQGRYEEAEGALLQALSVVEALGPHHPERGRTLVALADLRLRQDRAAEAEPLLREALEILRRALGPDHREVEEAAQLLLAARRRLR